MKTKIIFYVVLVYVIIFIPVSLFAEVTGYMNKFYEDIFPCKLALYSPVNYNFKEDIFIIELINIFKKYKIELVDAPEVKKKLKKLTNNYKDVATFAGIKKKLFNPTIIKKLKTKRKVNGILIVSPAVIFNAFIFFDQILSFEIYSIDTFELVYKLDMKCGFLTKCSTDTKTVLSYLKGDFEKELKNIECR